MFYYYSDSSSQDGTSNLTLKAKRRHATSNALDLVDKGKGYNFCELPGYRWRPWPLARNLPVRYFNLTRARATDNDQVPKSSGTVIVNSRDHISMPY